MDRSRIAGGVMVAVVLGALGFVVAGCGSSSASPPATTTSTTTTSTGTTGGGRFNSADFQKYQSCLKAHGVTLPQFNGRPPGSGGQTRTFTGPRTFTAPPGGGTSTTQRRTGGFAGRLANLTPAQRKAAQTCQSLLPQGGFQFGQGGRSGGGAGGTAFAKYTQCLSKHGVKFGQSGQSSAAFKKAQTACKSLLPAPTTTGTTTTTTG
jgi:hypothetical protein